MNNQGNLALNSDEAFLGKFYDKYALLLILLIATLSTLPWIGLGEFYTKGEPREAVLAISMIEKGEWIIPTSYADEFAYKPPLNHWIIAGVSLLFNGGEVTPFTSRLPSALAFVAMIGVCFVFFAKRLSKLESFVASLIVITCFEIHRAAVTTRLDMTLTFFMVAGVIQLYLWHEGGKLKQIVSIWLLLTLAALVKGPIGILLPCLIFGIYLLTQKENFFKAIWKCIIAGLPALIVPILWYYVAYQIKGDDFLIKVFAENFGRFLRIGTETLGIDYNLGVENPWYYYPVILLAGFAPWTILLIISLFFVNYSNLKQKMSNVFNKSFLIKILNLDKTILFTLLVVVVTLAFFTIPASKRSTYILIVYPFLSIFVARLFIHLSRSKSKSVQISTSILVGVGILVLLIVSLAYFNVIDIEAIGSKFSKRERTLNDIRIFSDLFKSPGYWGGFAFFTLLAGVGISILMLKTKKGLQMLMAGFLMMLVVNVYMDSFLLPVLKNFYSPRPFAEMLSKKYDLKDKTYVTNNLLMYVNLYNLNFYLHNIFRNFEKELPESGYFIAVEYVAKDIQEKYSDQYEFIELERSSIGNEFKAPIYFFEIKKK